MINMSHLFFKYKKNENLFQDINLELPSGGICGLLGKNGSGKTSLLNLIAGLVFPDQGRCQVMQQIPELRHPDFLNDLYLLPEDLYVPPLTANDYEKLYAPFYAKFDSLFFHKCLQEFDLPRQKLLTELSQGQKKKFLLAFGLASQCRLFILDEPTNGLDIPSKAQFRRLLASAISDEKLFIVSTHQVHDLENLIDTVVVLDEGKIIFNENLMNIAKRYTFVRLDTEPTNSCLYFEKNMSGYKAILENKTQAETQIDLELLFNALVLNKNTTFLNIHANKIL